MSQYVVTYLLDGDLTADAVGPFRTRRRAEEVRDELEALEDALTAEHGERAGMAVQIVELRSLAEGKRDIRDAFTHP